MKRPSFTGSQRAPLSRERNRPPQALGSCASTSTDQRRAKTSDSSRTKQVMAKKDAASRAAGEEPEAAGSSPRRARRVTALRLARFLSGGQRDLRHPGP